MSVSLRKDQHLEEILTSGNEYAYKNNTETIPVIIKNFR
jgi:hypothetical protein